MQVTLYATLSVFFSLFHHFVHLDYCRVFGHFFDVDLKGCEQVCNLLILGVGVVNLIDQLAGVVILFFKSLFKLSDFFVLLTDDLGLHSKECLSFVIW